MSQIKPIHRSSSVSSRAEAPSVRSCGISAQTCDSGLWLDGLIADGDPEDLISLLHRQAAWRGLLVQSLPTSHG